jgi:hypothetical protein
VVIGTEAFKDFEVFLHRQHIKRELIKAKEKAKDQNTVVSSIFRTFI